MEIRSWRTSVWGIRAPPPPKANLNKKVRDVDLHAKSRQNSPAWMSVSQFYLLLYCSFNHPKKKTKKEKLGFWFGLGTPIGRFFLLNISTHRHTYGRTWTRLVGWSTELQSLCVALCLLWIFGRLLHTSSGEQLVSAEYQLIMFAASCFTLRAITRFQSVPGLFLPLWQTQKSFVCVVRPVFSFPFSFYLFRRDKEKELETLAWRLRTLSSDLMRINNRRRRPGIPNPGWKGKERATIQ